MGSLTEYPRPSRDLRTQAAVSAWHGPGGWALRDSGEWSRVYSNRHRKTVARRAVIYREAGVWLWRVEEFDLMSRKVRRIANRIQRGKWHVSPAAAMPWADLAARTSD